MKLSRFNSGVKIVALSGLAAMFLMMPGLDALADDTYENTIMVNGVGSVKTPPDSVSTQFSVQTRAKTMAEAREQNAQKVKAVVGKLKGLAIAGLEIETEWFNANPVYDYSKDGKQRIIAYEANHSMSAKVERVKDKEVLEGYASKLTDMALLAGATNASNVNFYISTDNEAYDRALTLAVKRARQKADVLATAAGTSVTGIYTIESHSSGGVLMERSNMAAAPMALKSAEEDYAQSPISAGMMEITANVSIRFDIAD